MGCGLVCLNGGSKAWMPEIEGPWMARSAPKQTSPPPNLFISTYSERSTFTIDSQFSDDRSYRFYEHLYSVDYHTPIQLQRWQQYQTAKENEIQSRN